MRLPNIVTAISDVLAGVAIGGSLISITFGRVAQGQLSLGKLMLLQDSTETVKIILLLILATSGLYGGGVVLNDVFDAELDKTERPERPIPSGLISKRSAAIFGTILLLIGITAAAFTNRDNLISQTALIATVIAIGAVIYDKWSKHNSFAGPMNMGLCRGLNLLMGMSVVTYAIQFFWYIALVPVIYIAAITMISRGEVHGGSRKTLYFAAALYMVVVASILLVSFFNNTLTKSLPFVLLFSLVIFPALQSAILRPEGPRIRKAVKSGVLALILMNASWAAAFGDLIFAGAIFILLPISYLLARLFAVT